MMFRFNSFPFIGGGTGEGEGRRGNRGHFLEGGGGFETWEEGKERFVRNK